MGSNPEETAYSVTFTEEILNGKLHFMCSVTNRYELKDNICRPNKWRKFVEHLWIYSSNSRTPLWAVSHTGFTEKNKKCKKWLFFVDRVGVGASANVKKLR